MGKIVVFSLVVIFVMFTRGICLAEVTWDQVSREEVNIKSVLIDSDNPKIIYMGASGVLKSLDGGDSWRNILLIRGQNKAVNHLAYDYFNRDIIYAATGGGLFCSNNQGENWKRIFHGKNYLEDECLVVLQSSSRIFLGTRSGLFISSDHGRHWSSPLGKLKMSQVVSIAYNTKDSNCFYVVCPEAVFKTLDAGNSWERVFALGYVNNANAESQGQESDLEEDEEDKVVWRINYIAVSPDDSGYLVLATSRGVYKSDDAGKNWQALPSYGLLSNDVKFLLFSSQKNLYALTNSGVFEYKDERWMELSFGLAAGRVNFLSQNGRGDLYAACANGLFKTKLADHYETGKSKMIGQYFKDEPAIEAVQDAAVRYAQAYPEKTLAWQALASRKAALPKVSVGISRDTSDMWHWESGSTTKSDDDVLRKGRDNLDWNVSLSWDLGELVWNNDQVSIDARARLNTQMREDILDQVTKLYFERLRVKMEMDNLSIEDRKKFLEKEFKLEELTASLNALTGGYFLRARKVKG